MSFGVPYKDPEEDEPVAVEDLDDYARQQWENVLGYMVGNPGKVAGKKGMEPGASVTNLLNRGELVNIRGGKVQITKEGFAFLLQDVNAQVWQILMLYIEASEEVSPYWRRFKPTQQTTDGLVEHG